MNKVKLSWLKKVLKVIILLSGHGPYGPAANKYEDIVCLPWTEGVCWNARVPKKPKGIIIWVMRESLCSIHINWLHAYCSAIPSCADFFHQMYERGKESKPVIYPKPWRSREISVELWACEIFTPKCFEHPQIAVIFYSL